MAVAVRLDALRAQRVAAGHSVQRLAQLANVTDQTINALEAIGVVGGVGGSCDEATAVRLANALGVSVATCGRAPL